MALRLEHKWVWDFWFAEDGDDYHMFYLQADRSLQAEHLRHWHVSVGHAVSKDLRTWQILADAIHPSGMPEGYTEEAFDSYTTWTGSVIRREGVWHMLYTGSKRSEEGLRQRVGLATSSDLVHWKKHPNNPLIEVDPRWYEELDRSAWHDQAWRDPYVIWDEATQAYHVFITARVKDGPTDARGVIAHAHSKDLIQWEVLPPVTKPGEFGHMEVPQWLHINGRYYLLFCVGHGQYSASRIARVGPQGLQTGTHYLVADKPFGPYRYLSDEFLCGDDHGSLYSGKLIQDRAGEWQFMAFRSFTPENDFIGEINDPIPVAILEDGQLMLRH